VKLVAYTKAIYLVDVSMFVEGGAELIPILDGGMINKWTKIKY
jgi:hypothetical protein